jgi:type I restriction enzyme S subunit
VDSIEFMTATATREQINKFRIKVGDTLITKDSETADDIGVPAFVAFEAEDLICGYHLAIVRPDVRQIVPRFLYWALDSEPIARQWGVTAAGVTRVGIRSTDLSRVTIPLPPLDEQRVIADYLDHETAQIDALVAKQEEFVALLRARRTAIVDAVVTRGLRRDVPLRSSGTAWIGDIPVDWNVRPLWSMFRRVKDVGHPEEQMLSVFKEYGVIAKNTRDNNNQTAENRNIYQLVHPGWLVTNRMKAWQGSVGISPLRGIVSGHYLCFEPRHEEDSRYLNWLFRCPRYAAGYASISRGVRIGQAEIDNDDYRVLPVIVPPKAEQTKIAEYLDDKLSRIDALIAKTKEHIVLAKERRSTLITAAVTGQIDVHTARKAS